MSLSIDLHAFTRSSAAAVFGRPVNRARCDVRFGRSSASGAFVVTGLSVLVQPCRRTKAGNPAQAQQ